MNENVIRICHLGNLYRNSSLLGGVRKKIGREKRWWKESGPEEAYIYIYERVERWCVTVENAFNNDSRVYIFDIVRPRPHRQMSKFAGYYCSNISDSDALSIIYANIREFTNSIVHASGKNKIFKPYLCVYRGKMLFHICLCDTSHPTEKRYRILYI